MLCGIVAVARGAVPRGFGRLLCRTGVSDGCGRLTDGVDYTAWRWLPSTRRTCATPVDSPNKDIHLKYRYTFGEIKYRYTFAVCSAVAVGGSVGLAVCDVVCWDVPR